MNRRVALITGAAKGIGRRIALSMAEEGYDVIVNYHSSPEEAEKVCAAARSCGVRAMAVYADMGNVKSIENMFAEIDKAFPGIDVLVNNAGISSEVYFLDATEEDFDNMTAIDWKGLYFCSQFAAKRMIEKNIKGVIINMASNQVDGCWPRATI